LVAPHEICNDISCITVNKLYFVKDDSITCPLKRLKIAYSDQAGKFRVASASTSKARRALESTRLVENCERLGITPRYMSPTLSSQHKITQKQRQVTTTTTTKATTTKIYQPLELSSILTNDDTFETASCSFSVEDLEYLNHKFPYNLFDDTGDAIYGTGLVAALLSFIFTLVKLHAKSAQDRSKVSRSNDYASPTRPTHLSASQSNTRQEIFNKALNFQPVQGRQARVHDAVHINSLPVQVLAREEPAASAIPLPFQAPTLITQQTAFSVPAVSDLNEVENYRALAYCRCVKGSCVSGNCKCNRAKRACGPLCHGGKANLNCKATLEYIYS